MTSTLQLLGVGIGWQAGVERVPRRVDPFRQPPRPHHRSRNGWKVDARGAAGAIALAASAEQPVHLVKFVVKLAHDCRYAVSQAYLGRLALGQLAHGVDKSGAIMQVSRRIYAAPHE